MNRVSRTGHSSRSLRALARLSTRPTCWDGALQPSIHHIHGPGTELYAQLGVNRLGEIIFWWERPQRTAEVRRADPKNDSLIVQRTV